MELTLLNVVVGPFLAALSGTLAAVFAAAKWLLARHVKRVDDLADTVQDLSTQQAVHNTLVEESRDELKALRAEVTRLYRDMPKRVGDSR